MQPGGTVLTRRRLIALSTGSAVALSLSGRAAWVQMQSLHWPNRVVRFIVPFAAGGPTDIVARVVTEQLSKIWGQQAVIENRGGAGTNIGNEMVARSDPDGYTVLFATASLAVNRSLYRPNRSWSLWPMQRRIQASSHWHPPAPAARRRRRLKSSGK